MRTIYIKPKDFVTVKKATSVYIEVVKLLLTQKAYLNVYIRDENNCIIEVKQVILEGECYHSWGIDDTYVKNFVLKSLELEEDKTVKVKSTYISDMYCEETLVKEEEPPRYT